jgi:hypothetical protein
VFIFGDDYFGRVDSVPGLFCVKTRFLHIWWFPLVPRESYLFLDQESAGRGFDGIRVPLRWKSVWFAWLQASSLVAIMLFLFGGGTLFTVESKGVIIHPIILGLIAWLIAFGFGYLYWLTCRHSTASVVRARALMLLAGLPEEELESRLRPPGSIEKTAGSITDPTIQGHPEGEFKERRPLS